ncbi:hypothetical protein BLOT_006272, partial [Blomia tropicalis]
RLDYIIQYCSSPPKMMAFSSKALFTWNSFTFAIKPIGSNPVWRFVKMVQYYTLFIETEAICHFVLTSGEIEYMVEDSNDQMLVYTMIALGIIRWSMALFGTNHCVLTLDYIAYERWNHRAVGVGVLLNRYKINLVYGWLSQYFSDYVVIHYLAYQVLYSPKSFLYVGNNVTLYSPLQRIIHTFYVALFSWLYAIFIRPEITIFNYTY